jgi:hypothetical protein
MADQQMIEQREADQPMFVQTAHSPTSDGRTLTLNEATSSTLYFQTGQSGLGHMTTADFVDLWGEGENSFEEDPPNADSSDAWVSPDRTIVG